MPKVSVILTSFNHEKYIREAVDSVLDQTFTDFELIIWDDASTDASWSVINSYSDRRIKAFRNEENKRPIFGVIKAISEVAAGEYIAIHHSDDVWEPDKLEKQVAFLDANTEIGAVFTNALVIGENGSPMTDEQHLYSNIFDQPNRTRHEWLRFFFSRGNALCHPSVLIRKICYADCGLYRYGFAQVGDFDMWIRLCLKYEIHVLPEKLVRFRVRDNEANTSGNRPDSRIRLIYEHYKLLPNYRNLTSFEDLAKVFPSAEKYYRNEDADMGFVLGMVALEEKPFNCTQLFGQDLLFEAISNPQRAAYIKRLYGFDYKSFIVLTGQNDVFWQERVANLNQQYTQHVLQIATLNTEISRIKSTYSWQITKPLRLVWNTLLRPIWNMRPNLSSLLRPVSDALLQLSGRQIQGSMSKYHPRAIMARHHLRGEGIEIGARQFPDWRQSNIKVRYVDNTCRVNNVQEFPKLSALDLADPDYIDDGFTLASLADSSEDFLIANHVLEHAQNPLEVLTNWARVLRPGGSMLLSVPIAETCFDRGRQITSLEHMLEDYRADPLELGRRNLEHYLEWVSISEPAALATNGQRPKEETAAERKARAENMCRENSPIHFHTFSADSFKRLLAYFSTSLDCRYKVVEVRDAGSEVIAVISRS